MTSEHFSDPDEPVCVDSIRGTTASTAESVHLSVKLRVIRSVERYCWEKAERLRIETDADGQATKRRFEEQF